MNFQLDYRKRRALLIGLVSLTSLILLVAIIKLVIWEMGRGEKRPAQSPAATAPTLPAGGAGSLPGPSPLSANIQATPTPSTTPGPLATVTPTFASPAPSTASLPVSLIIPVAGLKPDQLRDTFAEARSESRVHSAIDIMAPHNSPVLAAADGKIVRLFKSDRGGVTIYQLSPDQKLVLYYAHLDRYAADLSEGKIVKQGDLIGYVGDTGNAGAGNYHLHFGLWLISDPKRFWTGENINPYPFLKQTR